MSSSYTCGLVFDKGCCTLCALVCHRGHEVAYSRSSSFFCDCGAEVASAGEQNRAECKCISPLSEEEAGKLFRDEKAKNYLATTETLVLESRVPPSEKGEPTRVMDLFVKVTLLNDKEASTAVEQIKAAALHNSWVRTALGLLTNSQESLSSDWVLANQLDPSSTFVTRESIIAGVVSRSGIPLDLERLDDLKLVPIRAARAGTFNLKMSLDSTTDRVKRTTLARHGIIRSAVVADSRGRLIIAEPSSLVFCSVLPVVNTRFIDDPVNNQIGRSQMTVIASHALSFNVIGMRISKESERHVIVWGTSEACVIMLKRNWSGVERTFTLEFDLDPQDCESDYLVRCDWIPGSQTHVSVACGTFVKIYSIASADRDDNVTPFLSYRIA
jgi:E3 ubiquitin-protein ligase UBR4